MLKWPGCIAAALLFAIVQAGPSFAQSAPPAEKAEPAPAAEKPADKPAAETSAEKEAVRSPAAPAASEKASATAPEKSDKPKKKARKLTRQQELDRSLETGTVPARYRSQVPKEYRHLIPFADR